MPSYQEEENWDDDFEFANSPRNSPIPSAPIHHVRGASASASRPSPTYTRSNANLHSQRSSSALPRQTASRPDLHKVVVARKGRASGNSEEDWDLDEPTLQAARKPARASIQQQLRPEPQRKGRWSGNSEEDWDMEDATPAPAPPSKPVPPPLKMTAVPPLPSDHPQPRPSLDSHGTHGAHHLREHTSGTGGGVSPTMSAFSIPISIDSSLRTGGHPHERSIGGSSTNFLLHTGRRSLLEMEKGRQQQDRERRRLRKKSRPGAVQVDEDTFDVYGRPMGMRRQMEENSSDGSSGEEEIDVPAVSTPPASTPLKPSRLLTALNPAKSLDRLGSPANSSPAHSPIVPRPTGLGSRSTTVTNIPPTSTPQPSKLVRKSSNTNVLTKSTPHLRASKLPSASPSITPRTIPEPTPRPDPRQEPPPPRVEVHDVQQQHAAAPSSLTRAKEDCNTSLAPSTSSNKRTPLLSRLGSLKRWGQSSPGPSTSSLGISRPGRESVSPRVFGSRLPSFLGGSKVDLHAEDGHSEGRSPPRRSALGKQSSSSAPGLAPVPNRDEEGSAPAPAPEKKDDAHGRRGMNPFRRVSIQGVKRLVGEHHDHETSTPTGTPDKKDQHHRNLSFTALARGKLSPGTKHKEVASGRKSTDGRESPRPTTANTQVPHTLGRTAALAKAPKPPLKPLSSKEAYNHQNLSSGSVMDQATSSMRMALPSSVSTATSAGYQSSATSAAQSSTHRRTTSGATSTTASSISQSSPIMSSPPFSLAGQRSAHTRETTARSGISADHTPKPMGGKPLPDVLPATVGRVEGSKSAAAAKDARVRSGSAGDTSRAASPPGYGSRRGMGDLKIPARISMRQGSLKRELEAVKEFASSVEDLKRLQTNHQSLLAALTPNPRRSSSRAQNQLVNPAMIQSIEAQYGMWWECAELLVELGGAAPPTIAGTPIQENQPLPKSQSSSNSHYGTQRSFSSSSSGGDLSTRQLELLKQMLSTPNPSTIKWPDGSRQEFSGSGSDHVTSSSARGTKSTLNSASSLHEQPPTSISRAQANSTNYPYSQGTWTSKNRAPNGSGSRPNLNGVFPTNNAQKSTKPQTSRATLSGSSAAGGVVTTDDTEEEVSDWDRESSSDSGKRKLASLKPPSSTASSSIDMTHQISMQTRLALTPETILPLLSYAREVKARLSDCLDELERARGRSRASPAPVSAAVVSTSAQHSSRGSRAPEIGTSTLRRA